MDFFLILLISLIFNEIIEINSCGLEKNTKKNIILRSKVDITTINIEDNESSLYTDESNSNIVEEVEEGLVTEISQLSQENNDELN